MIDTPADPLFEKDAEKLYDTLANVEVVALEERQLVTYWATSKPRLLLRRWRRHNK